MDIQFNDSTYVSKDYMDYGHDFLPTSWAGEAAATFEESLVRAPTSAIARTFEFNRAEMDEKAKFLTKDEWKDSKYYREGLKFPDGVNESVAEIVADRKDAERERQDVISRAPKGTIRAGSMMAVDFAAQMVDPLNVASAFVPIVSHAKFMTMANKFGGPLRARLATGAVEGLAGAAMVEPFVYHASEQEQADYGMYESLMAVGAGVVLGGTLHAGMGAAGDFLGVSPYRIQKNADIRKAAADAKILKEATAAGKTVKEYMSDVATSARANKEALVNTLRQRGNINELKIADTVDMLDRISVSMTDKGYISSPEVFWQEEFLRFLNTEKEPFMAKVKNTSDAREAKLKKGNIYRESQVNKLDTLEKDLAEELAREQKYYPGLSTEEIRKKLNKLDPEGAREKSRAQELQEQIDDIKDTITRHDEAVNNFVDSNDDILYQDFDIEKSIGDLVSKEVDGEKSVLDTIIEGRGKGEVTEEKLMLEKDFAAAEAEKNKLPTGTKIEGESLTLREFFDLLESQETKDTRKTLRDWLDSLSKGRYDEFNELEATRPGGKFEEAERKKIENFKKKPEFTEEEYVAEREISQEKLNKLREVVLTNRLERNNIVNQADIDKADLEAAKLQKQILKVKEEVAFIEDQLSETIVSRQEADIAAEVAKNKRLSLGRFTKAARTFMDDLRYSFAKRGMISFAEDDFSDIYKAERALKKLEKTLGKLNKRRVDAESNALYFRTLDKYNKISEAVELQKSIDEITLDGEGGASAVDLIFRRGKRVDVLEKLDIEFKEGTKVALEDLINTAQDRYNKGRADGTITKPLSAPEMKAWMLNQPEIKNLSRLEFAKLEKAVNKWIDIATAELKNTQLENLYKKVIEFSQQNNRKITSQEELFNRLWEFIGKDRELRATFRQNKHKLVKLLAEGIDRERARLDAQAKFDEILDAIPRLRERAKNVEAFRPVLKEFLEKVESGEITYRSPQEFGMKLAEHTNNSNLTLEQKLISRDYYWANKRRIEEAYAEKAAEVKAEALRQAAEDTITKYPRMNEDLKEKFSRFLRGWSKDAKNIVPEFNMFMRAEGIFNKEILKRGHYLADRFANLHFRGQIDANFELAKMAIFKFKEALDNAITTPTTRMVPSPRQQGRMFRVSEEFNRLTPEQQKIARELYYRDPLYHSADEATAAIENMFNDSGKIISLFETADVNSIVHEVGHALSAWMQKYAPEDFAKIAKWADVETEVEYKWDAFRKENPDIVDKGILRRHPNPYGAKGKYPEEVNNAQILWQNYGAEEGVEANRIYEKAQVEKFGEKVYVDEKGTPILDENGNQLKDIWDDEMEEWIIPVISSDQLKKRLLDTFKTPEGKKYLTDVIEALPKNADGTITAYRTGDISEGRIQSYTLSEGMAKTFSNQGTDIPPAGLPGLKGSYDDFGSLDTLKVRIDPEHIVGWSPFDAEILVRGKGVKEAPQPETGKIPALKDWSKESLEKFAKGFELYMMDGKAPIPELNGLFSRMREWLLAIYDKIKDDYFTVNVNGVSQKIEISKEVRDVLDSWLATDKQLKSVRKFGPDGSEFIPGGGRDERIRQLNSIKKFTPSKVKAIVEVWDNIARSAWKRGLIEHVDDFYDFWIGRVQGKAGDSKILGEMTESMDKTVKGIMTLFRKSDIDTVIHETGHAVLSNLHRYGGTKELEVIGKWIGLSDETIALGSQNWSDAANEQFAEAFLKYFKSGVAPNNEVRKAFDYIKKWITTLYDAVRKITPTEYVADAIQTDRNKLIADIFAQEKLLGDAKRGGDNVSQSVRNGLKEHLDDLNRQLEELEFQSSKVAEGLTISPEIKQLFDELISGEGPLKGENFHENMAKVNENLGIDPHAADKAAEATIGTVADGRITSASDIVEGTFGPSENVLPEQPQHFTADYKAAEDIDNAAPDVQKSIDALDESIAKDIEHNTTILEKSGWLSAEEVERRKLRKRELGLLEVEKEDFDRFVDAAIKC